MNRPDRLTISTPGRVCLFGEHQDYLALPVIPCAISLRARLCGKRTAGSDVEIHLPDIGGSERFPMTGDRGYVRERDYYRSVCNVLRAAGCTFSGGFVGEVRSTIPVNAGTSSSSALVVSWTHFLARMSDQALSPTPAELGKWAYQAEVLEFGEPGGMMDQYATAFGGTIAIDFAPEVRVERLEADLGTIVIGDSRQPKDTKGILSRVKDRVIAIAACLSEKDPGFSLASARSEELDHRDACLSADQRALLAGTLRNRDITVEARTLLRETPLDHARLGALLNEHQQVLRDVLKISTPKIDRMLDAALAAGAYGGKINGSGGGGCMFAYAPEHPERVAEAIERAGGTAYIVRQDEGSRVEPAGEPD
jgi:galactokinase